MFISASLATIPTTLTEISPSNVLATAITTHKVTLIIADSVRPIVPLAQAISFALPVARTPPETPQIYVPATTVFMRTMSNDACHVLQIAQLAILCSTAPHATPPAATPPIYADAKMTSIRKENNNNVSRARLIVRLALQPLIVPLANRGTAMSLRCVPAL